MTLGSLWNYLKAVRIPLLIACTGAVLAYWVDQVRELFYLLTTTAPTAYRIGAIGGSGLLGIANWLSARTLYRFDLPALPGFDDPAGATLREWLPRILGASVPIIMALGCLESTFDSAIVHPGRLDAAAVILIGLFLFEAALLLAGFVARRHVRAFGLRLPRSPSEDRRLRRWRDLPQSSRRFYAAIFIANVAALVFAAQWPGTLASLGPLAVILITAAFLVGNSTFLVIQAGQRHIPLVSLAVLLIVLVQWSGCGDNHNVRQYGRMASSDRPTRTVLRDPTLRVDGAGASGEPTFGGYVEHFHGTLPAGEPIYLVAAEGGGIRAAAWTALVLTELEVQSEGTFSRHLLAGSGVSGGSLGLALFATLVKARNDDVLTTDDMRAVARDFLQEDFLRDPLETMFLTDLMQRFIPYPVFADRGERLEREWERTWLTVCRAHARPGAPASNVDSVCALFGAPWVSLYVHLRPPVPVLFLNSTEVGSGRRFVQEPFCRLDPSIADTDVLGAADTSCGSLADTAPLSAVVHNSARFTYISPAGTLQRAGADGMPQVPLQLVDGGYFENSGATTLVEIAQVAARALPGCTTAHEGAPPAPCPLRFIHISNDPAVEPLLGNDGCERTAGRVALASETTAPVTALLNTRDARGAFGRHSLLEALPRTLAAGSTQDVFHFRLCEGDHHLPLGWTLSGAALDEMQQQLADPNAHGAGRSNSPQLAAILRSVRSAVPNSQP